MSNQRELERIERMYKKHIPEEAFNHLTSDIAALRKESEESKSELKKYIDNLKPEEITYLKVAL